MGNAAGLQRAGGEADAFADTDQIQVLRIPGDALTWRAACRS